MSIAREGFETANTAAARDSHFFAGAIHAEALARLEHLVRSLPELACQPGGYLHVMADRCEPGGVVRFVFASGMLVYRIESIEDGLVVMQWPD